jgi:hypothetical protein
MQNDLDLRVLSLYDLNLKPVANIANTWVVLLFKIKVGTNCIYGIKQTVDSLAKMHLVRDNFRVALVLKHLLKELFANGSIN